MKINIDSLLSKEMNRRDFLRYIGAMFLAFVGVTRFLSVLSHHQPRSSSPIRGGYGGSSYGR